MEMFAGKTNIKTVSMLIMYEDYLLCSDEVFSTTVLGVQPNFQDMVPTYH